ncbi:leech-derived tryptase inhibitor C-like [Hermetia illucens]|uniref:leech-derived tryptase inhibitor C-like n=1 Tax=Hermetia illucens TaxID=343691 RepID=UPI0018CC5686|nr:leech-derived tryptase inhibitor C-like [Hermetia illucens]
MRVLAIFFAIFIAVLCFISIQGQEHKAICPCPRNYDPVCGTDLYTYANKCLFQCEQTQARARGSKLEVLKFGECK